MMEIRRQHEKHIEEAIKKTGLEQPSPNFIANVMQKIEAAEKVTAYRPLIPKKGWLAIAAVALIFVVWSFYFTNDISLPEWLDTEKLSTYLSIDISDMITLSNNTIYIILLTAALILLQISIIKFRHNRTLWENHYQ